MYTLKSINISICSWVSIYKHEFIPSSTLFQLPHESSLRLSLLVYKLPFQYWEHSSHHQPSTYLLVQFQYTVFFSELLTQEAIRLSVCIQCLCTVPSAFSFTDYTHFQSYLGKNFILPLPPESLLHIFAIYLDLSHYAFYTGFPQLPKWYLKFACIKLYTLCAVKMGFWKSSIDFNVLYSSLEYPTE